MLLLKTSLLLSAMLLAAHLLRRAPAVSRHRLWTLAFAAMLALPLLGYALPVFYVPVPASLMIAPAISLALPATLRSTGDATVATIDNDEKRAASVSAVPRATSGQQQSPERLQPAAAGTFRPSLRAVLLTVWLAGTLAAAAALLLSLVRVRRLARAAGDITDPAWSASADALGARLGLRRPARLLVSAAVGTPMAGGTWRPVIFLPSSAHTWGAERRDVVLAHEIAHLAGHDPLRHVAARLAVALYWFHPLAWVAARQAAVAREQACDEAVLGLGTRPSSYARVLLELAESMQPSAAGIGALPMVERSHLETRLMVILKSPPPLRRSFGEAGAPAAARRGAWIPAIGVALGTLAIAAAQPGVRASAADDTPAPAAVQSAAPRPVAVQPKPGELPVIGLNAGSPQSAADSVCDRVLLASGRSFWGTSSTRGDGRIYDMIGSSERDRVIAKSLGDLRVCMLAEGAGPRVNGERPSQWPGRAPRVVLEARRGPDFQRLEITSDSGVQRMSWQAGGTARPFDAAAQQWRDRMLAALDTMWEFSALRGEVSSLRGEISSIRGEESSLRGEISSLQGEISSLRGRQSSVRGDESSLRGRISSIRGHLSSLHGAISSEQGSISSLNAGGYRPADAARARDLIAQHEKAIARLETEIRAYGADAKVAAIEREIAALDTDRKVNAIETEIRAFDLNGKVAAIERRIADLQVDGKVAAIERQIAALDADRRGRQLEERRDEELKRLEAAIAAIR